MDGASGYRLTTGLLASRLYMNKLLRSLIVRDTKTVAADGSSVLRLSEKFVQEIERQRWSCPGNIKTFKDQKDTIFSVEAKKIGLYDLELPQPTGHDR